MTELTPWLANLPSDNFWRVDRDTVPDFNGIFSLLATEVCGSGPVPRDAFLDGRLPNLSSFQRAVAREARRRRLEQLPA